MSRCGPLSADVQANWKQVGASTLSSRFVRGGEKLTYTVAIARARVPDGAGGLAISTLGFPITISCAGATACSVNGTPLAGSSGSWGNPVPPEFADINNGAGSYTFVFEFTISSTTAFCNGQVGYYAYGNAWDYKYFDCGAVRPLKRKEEERNKKDPCGWLCYGQAFLRLAEEALSYLSGNSPQPGHSFGWGWSSPYYKRVEVDSSNNDVTFYDGSGSFEVWEKVGSSYQALHANNYDTLVLNGSGAFVITTKHKRVLTSLCAKMG